jgi:serine/threonine protein kinase
MSLERPAHPERLFGRYILYDAIASGGMASVHFGRLTGAAGFARTVAIKRMHPQHAQDPDFVAMFVDEARLAARIRHPNVIPTLDVVAEGGEILLVMEYVDGESLSRMLRAKAGGALRPFPPRIACAILGGVMGGLHAAHEAKDEQGAPLNLIHRDVSPQNILVGVDGVARIFDFGIAKAATRLQQTRDGKVKGKLGYMAPEQLRGRAVTRTADIYSASVVLWETLTGRRLFHGESEGEVVEHVLLGAAQPPSRYAPGLPVALDDLVLRGLASDPAARFATAAQMGASLEQASAWATPSEIGAWLRERAGTEIAERERRVAEIESSSSMAAVVTPALPEPPTEATHVEGDGASASRGRAHTRRRLGIALATLAAGVIALVAWQRSTRAAPAATPPVSTPTAVVDRTADPTPPAPQPPPSAVPAAPAAAPKPSRPLARRGCNPPYTRDSAGHVHFKVECL